MSAWQSYLHHPQRTRLRQVLVKVHLWLALALGLYIVVLSLSGSAVVFRRELNVWLVPRAVPSTEGVRLTGDALRTAVETAYPEHVVTNVREPQRAERPVVVSLERRGSSGDRLFDPYAASDMGSTFPPTLRAVEWLVDLHDNLLAGPTGRRLNGIGGLATLVLIGTGAVIWWPGKRRWWRAFVIGKPTSTRKLLFDLHNALGAWTFALLLVWALTAVYFGFPEPVEGTIDYFDDDLTDGQRPGEAVLLTLIQLHFGRFGGLPVRFLWAALGLVPAVLFVSGFVLWWRRPRPRARAREPRTAAVPEAGERRPDAASA